MAIFKCKMCGGALEINNKTVIECEYCGTKQTLPKLEDERKANLYDRANHFRRNNEFDKAMAIYEQILNEDNTDAESYWSLVLCRYGIEYVEDPTTKRRIPTINRAQFTSIFDDEDYKSALKYADVLQKEVYEEEATVINNIQKGILAISQKEEPFDVFICYKETDQNGRRTPDSVLATELYHELAREGFKVFFSRITLEDKLGSAYEPYIFAALNSAKVMVVLGTKNEYFNAVWVKNEWSRYLALIKNGARKMLIPAYKDMDPYDLPEEFSHLQAQDMSKLGFMQDLIRGIKKIVEAETPKTAIIKETVIPSEALTANVVALLKRGFMSLEDGEWEKADDFFEQCLNQNAELAEAYIGKLMAELQVKNKEELKDCKEPFNNSNNYKKFIRFADSTAKSELEGYIDFINNRNFENAYNNAQKIMNSADTEADFKLAAEKFSSISHYKNSKQLAEECLENAKNIRFEGLYKKAYRIMQDSNDINFCLEAADIFEKINGYKDSDELAKQCHEKTEKLQKEKIYIEATYCMKGGVPSLERAINKFKSIEDYKDSKEKISLCQKKIEEIKEKVKAERLEQEQQANRKSKLIKKISIIAIAAVCLIIAFIIVLNTIIIPNSKYNSAKALLNAGKDKEAYAAFSKLKGYKDSNEILVNLVNQNPRLVFTNTQVDDIVLFGNYEQDGNIDNGYEPIEWIILTKEENKVLLISKYILEVQHYNKKHNNVTWETCDLREWLNNSFYSSIFSEEEQNCISLSEVSADPNPYYDYDSGNETVDKIFILSIDEAKTYLSKSERKCPATKYVLDKYKKQDIKEGADAQYINNLEFVYWWLRTPGWDQNNAALVRDDGSINHGGRNIGIEDYRKDGGNLVDYGENGVRPAMWIDLSKLD